MNNNNENNNNLNNMSEIEREKEEREKGRKAHHHTPIEKISSDVAVYSFVAAIAAIVIILILKWISNSDIVFPKIIGFILAILFEIMKITFFISAPIFVISFIIYMIAGAINDKIASKYCPYCYKTGYNKILISKTKIRSYKALVEKKKILGTFGAGMDNSMPEKIPALVEDWEMKYKNDCCGHQYTESETNYISLT